MSFKAKVLSIDGGGIKGIVPAMILAEIEDRTGKPICELFDLIAGTSTGGILALGLTKPNQDKTAPQFKAIDLVNLYKTQGSIIFQRRNTNTLHQITLSSVQSGLSILGIKDINIEDLYRTKYTRKGKEKIIDEYLGVTYLSEALTEVLIPSYATNLRLPFFFTSKPEKEREYQNSENFRIVCEGYKMQDAALATSAAPTYFKPYPLDVYNHSEPRYTLVDGGVFANNPTSIAILEAINSYKIKTGESISLDEILVVSLGTGRKSRKLKTEDIYNWGQIKWIEPLINMVLNGQSEVVDYQMEQLLSTKLPRGIQDRQYYRFQIQYPEIDLDNKKASLDNLLNVNDALDDTSKYNIDSLQEIARKFLRMEKNKLDLICELLT
ncbi:MAG: patatin-like phospholipase family protein [Aulosira sp. ZfuVER01]|nr:patatin-like phospholipase family protein [Aulosira sp. ZfuVER01]MDZ7999563.1 patatin-like phospholipase family protein [Aulosira sp. DedVER01a]MDZ8053978.1 patatin-like phospholipase family protein [Aulosira sp. ZfuCHP01]